eukprot:jgi/Mesvir1/3527/Mv12000-RA.1
MTEPFHWNKNPGRKEHCKKALERKTKGKPEEAVEGEEEVADNAYGPTKAKPQVLSLEDSFDSLHWFASTADHFASERAAVSASEEESCGSKGSGGGWLGVGRRANAAAAAPPVRVLEDSHSAQMVGGRMGVSIDISTQLYSSPLSVEQYSDDGIKAMLWSALDNEAGLEKQKTSSTPLLDLVAANPDSVVLVGNSGKLELLGNGTGEWIDRHATVMRFNTNWLAELRHLIGSKRDVWVVGDYRSACGDQGPQHCTPEQLAALWERVGPDVKVYNGETPEGHGHLHDVAFTHWTSKPFLWNYFLWLKSHDHPHIKTPFPYTTPTRTGTTGLFGCLIHGIVPHMVGFDTGGCMHADYYETLRAREMFAQHKRDSPLPGRPIMHYRHEPIILSELNEAGLVHLVEPEVREDCANGIAMGIHKRADVVPALAENPLGNPGPDTPLSH